MSKIEYGQLTHEEIASHEARKEEKTNLFVLDDMGDFRAWQDMRKMLEGLKSYPKNASKKAEKFLDYFEEVYTVPENGTQKKIPAYVLVDLFERSFAYFREDVDDKLKKNLAELQISILTDKSIPEEARNVLKGIWAFNADPKMRKTSADKDDLELRNNLLTAVRSVCKSYYEAKLAGRNKELTVLLNFPEQDLSSPRESEQVEKLQYFAKLYEAETIRELEPELSGILAHELGRKKEPEGFLTDFEGIIRKLEISGHSRLLTFEWSNRVPRAETIDEGRVKFVLTDESPIAEASRKEVTGYIIPPEAMPYLMNRIIELRGSEAYRGLKPEEQEKERRNLIVKFIREILNSESRLSQKLQDENILSARNFKGFEYFKQKNPKEMYLCFIMDIDPFEMKKRIRPRKGKNEEDI